jgi:hypothetical protein
MCRRIREETTENARGFFLKGNEPAAQEFPIIVAPCECGHIWFAKVPNGVVWVEAEKHENRDVVASESRAFLDLVGKVRLGNEAL